MLVSAICCFSHLSPCCTRPRERWLAVILRFRPRTSRSTSFSPCSRSSGRRSSHIAFAISRVLKRNTFEWAGRENRLAVRSEGEEAVAEFAFMSDSGEPFERVVLLRHFLHCCHARGLLTSDDLALLVQFKFDAARDLKASGHAALYSNASRQRMKRLLAKLRRIARAPAAATQLRLF
jgi:hypothetical protein